ncbi:MAG: type II CRISPR-associated endonuclease Cas1 [Alphaproteobacteria bacterium]
MQKTVEIALAGTKLSIRNRQLVIERPDHTPASLPVEDIGMIILDNGQTRYTQSVMVNLMEAGAVILLSGTDHLPLGMMLPFNSYHAVTKRQIAQTQSKASLKKRLWQQLVKSKIEGQARLLTHMNQSDHGLNKLAAKVRSGDPENVEAWAAQIYWPALFGKNFRRDRKEPNINALLNYGYAIIRASCARYLVASGMNPTLGVFHSNRSNPFCLADDMLEHFSKSGYRFCV